MCSLVYRQPSTKMDFILCLLLVFESVLFNDAQGVKMCDYTDIACLTNGAKNVYQSIIPGFKGVTKPIEPLYSDKIEGKIDNVKYQLTNVTLVGMGNCEVIHMSINKDDFTFDERLSCPELILDFKYEAKGNLGSIEIEESGLGKIIANEYIIIIKGKYGHFISEKDQKPHFFLEDHYVIDTNPKGKLTFNAKERLFKDKDKIVEALAYLNQNKHALDKYLRSPIMENFITEVVKGIGAVVRDRTQEEIFPKND